MKWLSISFAMLTIGISFTMDVWDGTAFALAPLLATAGGALVRFAAERRDYVIGLLLGGLLIGGCWVLMEWLDLTVALFDFKFGAEWWALPSVVIGFVVAPEDIY